MQPKTVLVQGASGFVASALLPKLASAGFKHFVLVDPREPSPLVLQALAAAGAKIELHTADQLRELRNIPPLSCAISVAGVTNVDTALENPALAFSANVGIAIDLAEWLRLRADRPRLVYISTDEVLGESWVALAEDAPLNPTQPYAASKAAAELILHNYRDVYGLDIVTLRSCNLIGGQQRARKLIPVAVACLMDSRPVPIYGCGTQLREWLAVEDACEAVLALLDDNVPAGVYQAASGVHLSVHEVVDIVARAIGRPVTKIHVNDRPVHDGCYGMKTCKIREHGWAPAIDPRHAITAAAHELAVAADLSDLIGA